MRLLRLTFVAGLLALGGALAAHGADLLPLDVPPPLTASAASPPAVSSAGGPGVSPPLTASASVPRAVPVGTLPFPCNLCQ